MVFVGHFALGFAAKRAVPRVSLSVLFAAVAFADLLWPFFLAFGIEQVRIEHGNTAFTPLNFVSYPYSHSLLMLMFWGVVFGMIYRAITNQGGRTVVILAALVISHWVLDWVTHQPDLPLYPGGAKFGLGLWNSVAGTVVVEVAMFAVGVCIYAAATQARDKTGRWAFIGLAAFLLISYFANIASPPPPSVPGIYITALIGSVVLLAWSWWADRHRLITSSSGSRNSRKAG